MKKILIIMCACLMGALSGAKAWTSAAPQVGKAYYLHCTVYPNQFWGASKTDGRYYVTSNLSNAVPVFVESISGTTYAMSFYLGGTKYYLHQHNGNIDWPTSSSTMEVPGDANGYAVRNDSYSEGLINPKSGHRYMWPYENEGGISFGKVLDENAGPDYCWQFVPVEEAMSYMANHCASVAETNNVGGWERVTSLEMLKDDSEKYFFAIFSTNVPALMVRTEASNGQGYYLNATDPLTNPACLFGIESYRYESQDYFALKAENNGAFYYPLWDHAYELFAPADGKKTADDACRLTFSYADNAWSIKTWAVYDETAGKMAASPGHFTLWCGPSANPKALKKTRYTLK